MNKTLTAQIGELAESLHDLRRRFRHSARYEVACVIGEALRDAAMALIGGPAPRAKMPGRGYAAWNDPWGEPVADRWHGPDSFPDVMEADEEVPQSAMRLSPSLLVGMGAARWSFARTRQLGPAMLIGLLVALIATIGSPTIQALVDAWSVAIDLLSPSSSDREL